MVQFAQSLYAEISTHTKSFRSNCSIYLVAQGVSGKVFRGFKEVLIRIIKFLHIIGGAIQMAEFHKKLSVPTLHYQ